MTLTGHQGAVLSCAISRDGRLIASVAWDGTLKIWDVHSGDCLATFPVSGVLFDCAWFPDGQRLVAVGGGGIYFLRLVR
jgi:WD40 repeat protein